MQAIILASRSINQDKFFQKDLSQKYKKHRETLSAITKQKQYLVKGWQKEVKEMSNNLRKSKSAAKNFKQRQQQNHLKEQNMLLLKKIWHVQPSISTYNNDKFQYLSGSNWNLKKRQIEQIKQQNIKIGKKFVINQQQHLDYKKKLKQEIKDYMQRRDNIRKFKVKSVKAKRPKSESKQILVVVKKQEMKQQKLPAIQKIQTEMNPQTKVQKQ